MQKQVNRKPSSERHEIQWTKEKDKNDDPEITTQKTKDWAT